MTTSRIVAVVPARGGSQGLPDKNIADLGGRPLLEHSLRPALDCPEVAAVYLNSDSDRYLEIATRAGARTYKRGDALGTATTTMRDVMLDFAEGLRARGETYDAMLVLYPTYPFRTPRHLSDIIAAYEATDGSASMVGIVPPKTHPFLVYDLDERGGLVPLLGQNEATYYRRQDYPQYYALCLWVCVLPFAGIGALNAQMLGPRTVTYRIPPDVRVVDIDYQKDLDCARFLLASGQVPAVAGTVEAAATAGDTV